MDRNLIDKTILDALKEADENGIKGKDTTPFLLDKVQRTCRKDLSGDTDKWRGGKCGTA